MMALVLGAIPTSHLSGRSSPTFYGFLSLLIADCLLVQMVIFPHQTCPLRTIPSCMHVSIVMKAGLAVANGLNVAGGGNSNFGGNGIFYGNGNAFDDNIVINSRGRIYMNNQTRIFH